MLKGMSKLNSNLYETQTDQLGKKIEVNER